VRIESVLTVSESKRLIAKGVKEFEIIKKALRDGMVTVAMGTTNTYVAEEFTGQRIAKFGYTTGLTLPKGSEKKLRLDIPRRPAVVFRKGKLIEGLSVNDSVKELKAGDVFIKGANALNYREKVAGVLVGDPTGGTVGNAIGHLIGRKVHLVIPIGLEKCIPFDIVELSRQIALTSEGKVTSLFPVTGVIVTEIEALETLADVQAVQVGAGGVAGAEGSVRLQIEGEKREIEKVESVLEGIYGEEEFGVS
jgi:hypothetical protein